MKKLKILCAALLTIGLFTACKGPSGGDNNPGEKPEVKPSNEEAIVLYKKLIGSKWEKMRQNGSFQYPEIVKFSENYVSFDNVHYSLDQNNNLTNRDSEAFFIALGTETYEITFLDLDPLYTSPVGDFSDSSQIFITNTKDPVFSENRLACRYACISTNTQGGDSSSEGDETSVAGNYSFTASSGTEMSGSLTLSNGEWSYSGTSRPAATSGTYTVNGSKITVKWTAAGLSFNETFTITKNGNTVTWKSDNEYSSAFLTMLFKISATKLEITFDYTE